MSDRTGSRRCLVALVLIAWLAPAQGALPKLTLNNPTNPPLTTKDRAGLLDLFVGEAVRRCGYELALVQLPAERGLINANAGIEDGDLSRIAGLEKQYPNLVRVREKIFDMDFVALTRKPSILSIDWHRLDSLTVGYIRGWKIFEQHLKATHTVTTADSPEQLLELLKLDRADVVLYSNWMGLALAKELQIDAVRVVQPPLVSREMFVYLHQRHADLAPQLASAMRALKREGAYQRAFDRTVLPLQREQTK